MNLDQVVPIDVKNRLRQQYNVKRFRHAGSKLCRMLYEMEMVLMQVRQTDQVWYHHRLQVSSLAVDLQWCYCPLLEKFIGVKSLLGKLHRNENHDESAN